MAGPGEDIAQQTVQGLSELNPVTKMMGMAQSGGQGILDLLMKLGLLQQPMPMSPTMPPMAQGGTPVAPQQGLKGRMTQY